MLGLCQRTAHRPDLDAVRSTLFDGQLVRAWGQRDTVHIYPPEDWPLVVAARPQWTKTSGRTPDPYADALADDAAAHMATLDRPVTRTDFQHLVTQQWLDNTLDYFDTYDKKWRYCTGRLIWVLGNRGLLSHHDKDGSEQRYMPRRVGFPDLDFSASESDDTQAAALLARRYLRTYGPATVQDIAHFFGANVSSARGWLPHLPDLIEVTCGGRELLAAAEDEADLLEGGEPAARLLPGYDNVLMGHADKSWIVPDEAARTQVWRKAAVLEAVVLDKGRVVGTWKSKTLSKRVDITITPLPGWSSPDLGSEAQVVAAHLGRGEARVLVA